MNAIDVDEVSKAEATLDFWLLNHAEAWELKLRFEKAGNSAGNSALAKWFLFSFRKSMTDPNI